MKKYNFMGKDTHEKEFWRLCSLTNLEEIEEEVNGKPNKKEIEKVLFSFRKNLISTPKCDSCGSQMILNNANFGKYWHCSNIAKCISIRLI